MIGALLAVPAAPALAQSSILDTLTAGYTPAACNTVDVTPGTARCFASVADTPAAAVSPQATAPAATALGPADIQAAYHLPATGDGQTVAIVDAYGNSHVEDDLAIFRSQYGLPPCTTANGCFRKVDQNGGTSYPADDSGWGLETALDVDAVSAACPACDILLVQGDTASIADLGAAVDTAVRLGAKYVSNSYGTSVESADETVQDAHYDHPGVVIAAASGDTGNIQIWPSTSPDVLAVGGTTLTKADGTDRGWTESAWAEGGSGCSYYEPQPDYQASLATGCTRRATTDISADADPNSGLAVYDTLGYDGWKQVGGTSLATPLVTAMYALAGAPVEGTYPVTYPYVNQGNGLFDVTTGKNSSCGTVLCTAGTGWDGPTGLGTPDGIGALTLGAHGTVTGTITDGTGAVAKATVTLHDPGTGKTFRATTDANGKYSVVATVGTYDATVTAYGYGSASQTGVAVAEKATVTLNLSLVKVPTRHVSGKVTDASGHGYPLAATITVDGYPGGAIHTDPFTGAYAVDLPEDATYTVHAAATYPGYQTADSRIVLADKDVTQDFPVTIEASGCTAAGYAYPLKSTFEGWTGSTPQQGWTVTDHATSGLSWVFDDTTVNLSGGSGQYAAASPFDHGGKAVDADLISPVVNLGGAQAGVLQFDGLVAGTGITVTADVSTDDGTTWNTVWSHNDGSDFIQHVTVAIPRSPLRVRFHYAGSGLSLMQLDNVSLGQCAPTTGGLVAGTVTDANTKAPVTTASIVDRSGTSAAVATDANGYYWTFSTPAGKHAFDVTAPRYAAQTVTARTVDDAITRRDLALQAGKLLVTPGSITADGRLGRSASRRVTLTNTGKSTLNVSFVEQGGSSTGSLAGVTGAPVVTVPGDAPTASHSTSAAPVTSTVVPSVTGSAWTSLAPLPAPVQDNASGYYRGRTYSIGGITSFWGGSALATGYVYDPATQAWSSIADLPSARASAAAAFLNGTLYVVGGWGPDFAETSTVYAYHPDSDKWTQVASLPVATGAASAATLGGKLYVVGGCLPGCDTSSAAVYRYDPAHDTWTRLADYPTAARWTGCAGATGQIVCTGGVYDDAAGHAVILAGTYRYSPSSNTWTQGASLPAGTFGMTAAGANGMLQIVGGAIRGATTNRALQYDPVGDVWSDLPAAGYAELRGSGGCGMTLLGGWPSLGSPAQGAEELSGLDGCEGDDVSWLSVSRSGVSIPPGRSVTVTVRLDGYAPGLHTATLFANTDSPYDSTQVPVTYRVNRR